MKISEEKKKELEEIYQKYLHDEKILRMKDIPMHRGSNCYLHSFKVAKLAVKHALRHKNVLLEVVLLAAILHDYYLYDWRVDHSKLARHGKDHPYVAAEQAERDFDISLIVKKAIESHMWPLNITEFPSSKEARIVTVADKMVASQEALTSKKYKKEHEEEYYQQISTLF